MHQHILFDISLFSILSWLIIFIYNNCSTIFYYKLITVNAYIYVKTE